MKTIKFPQGVEYYTNLANGYKESHNYSKACANYIKALKLVKNVDQMKSLIFKLAYCLGKEGNYEFKEQALMSNLCFENLDIKTSILLFINSYRQKDYEKTEHYFRLMQETLIENMLSGNIPDKISQSDEDIDIEVYNAVEFDEKNIFPINYHIEQTQSLGYGLGSYDFIMTTPDNRADRVMLKAKEKFDLGKLNESLEYIDDALSYKNISEELKCELYNIKAYVLYQNNQIKKSFDCLQKGAEAKKKDIKILSLTLAFAQYSQNEALKEETLEEMLSAETNDIGEIKIILSALCRLNKLDTALDYINKKLASKPYCYEYNKLKAILLINQNKKKEAESILVDLVDKYGTKIDARLILYALLLRTNQKFTIDCDGDTTVDANLQNQLIVETDIVNRINKGGTRITNELEFDFDYLLRQPYEFIQVTKNLYKYITQFDVNHEFLDHIIRNAYLYNSKYLIPLTYYYTLHNIGKVYLSKANGLFTKNPIIDFKSCVNAGSEISDDVVKGIYLAFSVAVNSKVVDKRMIMHKMYRTFSILCKANTEALGTQVHDEIAFAALMYRLSFSRNIVEDYDNITYDKEIYASYAEIFDIINYEKYINIMEAEERDNFR